MESLLYKTPSPVTAKRRLSGIPSSRNRPLNERKERVVSEQIQRIQRDWPDLQDDRSRRGSVGNVSEFAQSLREESDSVDSSMGFRELERHIAKIKRQNFDLKLELHIRREKMAANADKIHQAEGFIRENEELHETLQETRQTLKNREEELVSCKALIRLLSEQLENAHKRVNAFINSPLGVHLDETSIQRERPSVTKTPTMQSSEFVKSLEGSPVSLVSLESSIGSQSEDEIESDDTDMQEDTVIDLRNPIKSMREVRVPFKLEHSPKVDRRGSIIDSMVPVTQRRTPLYTDRRQSGLSFRNSSVPTPPVTQPDRVNSKRVTPLLGRGKGLPALPPTPDDSPVPSKLSNRAPLTLRGRFFRSKTDVHETQPLPDDHPKDPPQTIVKKNSLIRFWKPKSPTSTRKQDIKPTAKEIFNYPLSPEKTPKLPPRETTNITLPDSDHLSRYPKMRPVSVATTQTTAPWHQNIGRQVSDMVQHWEHETTRRNDLVTCANYISTKRLQTTGASPLAVKAARDAWTATTNMRRSSEERGEKIEKLRRQRDELVRKLGLSTVPSNTAAA